MKFRDGDYVTTQRTSKRHKANHVRGVVLFWCGVISGAVLWPARQDSPWVVIGPACLVALGGALQACAAMGKWWEND